MVEENTQSISQQFRVLSTRWGWRLSHRWAWPLQVGLDDSSNMGITMITAIVDPNITCNNVLQSVL